jgi:hypothetical protein
VGRLAARAGRPWGAGAWLSARENQGLREQGLRAIPSSCKVFMLLCVFASRPYRLGLVWIWPMRAAAYCLFGSLEDDTDVCINLF